MAGESTRRTWALVFPLGMYGAATFKMGAVVGLDQPGWLPKFTLVVALAAWTGAMAGLLWQGVRAIRPSSSA